MIGIEGERIAQHFFNSLGFEILETNWRYKHQEIDIIAVHNKILHIIEVKTQTSDTGGLPEENRAAWLRQRGLRHTPRRHREPGGQGQRGRRIVYRREL